MDGCVALYKRDDGSDLWQYRLRVPGVSNSYLHSSIEPSNFNDAKQIALKEWNSLCFRHESGSS